MRITKWVIPLLAMGLILGTYQGYIALWQDESRDPLQIYSYKAELLPPEEQIRLTEGITIRDETHLRSLLRDFLS